ncbi:MAG: nitroreductase family protein [Anaerolineae bacterium]|nr:nitroreductase family protein [Anaerolineae bacterium]
MEFSELIRARYSVRAYSDKPVEDAKLRAVLEAARLAPTAVNRQPVRIIVIHTKGREEELRRIYHREWFTQAPLVIAMCALLDEVWVRSKDGKSHHDVDAAIVMDHLILAAADQGLGTCWIGAFDPDAAREVLGLPANVEPIVFTPLGYAADAPGDKRRKTLDELVRYERW